MARKRATKKKAAKKKVASNSRFTIRHKRHSISGGSTGGTKRRPKKGKGR